MKNIIAVIVGLIVGSAVNMGFILLNPLVIDLPEGVDVSNMDNLKNTMHLFQPKNFIFPFLAHAVGTLVGAIVASLIAKSHKMRLAFVIGFVFLAGGLYNAYALPAPLWFIALDIIAAYIPMAYIGGLIGAKK